MPFPSLIVDGVTTLGAASINPIIAEHTAWNAHRNAGGYNLSGVGVLYVNNAIDCSGIVIGTGIVSNGDNPYLLLENPLAPVDNRKWLFQVQGTGFAGYVTNDAGNTAAAWVSVGRTGNVANVSFPVSRVTIAGFGTGDVLDVNGGVTVRNISAGPNGALSFFDYSSGGGRIVSRGVNTSTNGSISFITTRSDGSNVYSPLFISAAGHVMLSSLPSYANNAAAISGGLPVGALYLATSGDPRPICRVI